MATTVDSILVRIDADLGDLRKELNRLDKTLNKTAQKTETSLKKVSNAFRTVLGAAVVYQTAQAGLALVNFVSGIEEMQAKSDVVFGQFVGNVRDELGSFAEAVGRSRFELEAMAASVQDTFVPLGFARGEAAQLSVQLAKLATDVASFNNASDTETMEAFQSAIVGNHETVRRFGIVITEATLTQELHRMGIRKTSQEASNAEKVQARLNLIMNGTSDAHGDAARTADSFANRSKALGAALEELAVTVVGPFLNTLADFVGLLTDGIRAINGFFEALGGFDGGEIPKTFEGINDALENVRANIAFTEEELENLQKPIAGPLGEDTPMYQAMLAQFEAQRAALEARLQQAKTLAGQLELAKQDLIAAQGSADIEVATPDAEPLQSFKQEDKALSAIRKLAEENALLEAQLNGASEAQLSFLGHLQKLENLSPEQVAALQALTEANAGLKAELEATDPYLESVVNAYENAGRRIADSIGDAFVSGQLSMETFKDITKDLISQIISNFIRLQVINPIINSMFGLTGQNALATGNMFGRAGGGSVSARKPYVVGERGPEIFVPSSAGNILNNMNSGNAVSGSGVVINQSLNFSLGVQDTVRAEVMNLMPVISNNAVGAVQEARTRGGAFARQFGG